VNRLEVLAVEGLPEVQPGDDLSALISARARFEQGDVLVIAQKIVSKSEGRLVDLKTVEAGEEAVRIASQLIADPDPRMVQVVLGESVRVLRSERVLITETRHGFICANGGVDRSNIPGGEVVSLLPVESPQLNEGPVHQLAELPALLFHRRAERRQSLGIAADLLERPHARRL